MRQRSSGPGGFRSALPRLGLSEDSPLPTTQLAARLVASREWGAALLAYRELVEQAPDDLRVLEAFAGLLGRLGRSDDEADVHRRIAAITVAQMGLPEADREAGIAYRLATLGIGVAPARVPAAYVNALFDGYAAGFDAHLRGELRYRGPELVIERLAPHLGAPRAALDVCDLGCGTGLFGPVIRGYARRLDGVDVSTGMLARAREGGLYDELVEGDITDVLASRTGTYDLVAALDVLGYFGDLTGIFEAAARALRAGGTLAITVERADEGYRLEGSGRYRHSAEHVRASAERARLGEVVLDEVALREEQGRVVSGLVAVLHKE